MGLWHIVDEGHITNIAIKKEFQGKGYSNYLLKEIDVPCLLVWGENDDATPLSDGKLMEKLIPDAGLVVMPDSGHYAFLENRGWFGNILRNFCGDDMK